jgi:Zn-dependent protease with chaperone function
MQYQVRYKEKLYLIILAAFSSCVYLCAFFIVFVNPEFSLTLLAIGIFRLITGTLLMGYLKGNAIKLSHTQLPDAYEILEAQAKKLELKTIPDAYLLQHHGLLNAFATKILRRDYVVIFSDVLEVAYQEGKDAVAFIIGHELGHIKQGHTSFFRTTFILPGKFLPFLGKAYSRACEYTCDNIGYALAPHGASMGILVLAAGKKLYKKINLQEILIKSKYEKSFAVTFFEIFSTHPVLTKRLANIDHIKRTTLTPETPAYYSPQIEQWGPQENVQ